MARGLVLSVVKKSCKKIVARCTIGVRTVIKIVNLNSTYLHFHYYFELGQAGSS